MGFLKTRATRWFLLLAFFFIFGSITTALIMWFSPESLYRCLDGLLGVHWPEPEADIDLGLDEPSMPPQEGIELQPMAARRLEQD
ncbi:hypothetical protein N7513_007695 [Penicillium frequentans]|nr:hypothetical protein N7513_007695 [Penicillium glabrum]